ncbi:hypothetical protein [Lichenicoccus sp.]|uniref:hypothetical protein n=1 Tax=Lichenicoccus sp. TaxID=2781899 RepID=UPI003D0CEB6C
MIIAFLLTGGALAMLAWIVFNLAVYALPFFAGVSAASLAYAHGSGLVGAGLVGFAAGALVLALGRTTIAAVRSPTVRILILGVYAAPAAIAGFAVTKHIIAWTTPSEVWQTVFALAGGAVTAAVAYVRLTVVAPPDGPGMARDRDVVAPAFTVSSKG